MLICFQTWYEQRRRRSRPHPQSRLQLETLRRGNHSAEKGQSQLEIEDLSHGGETRPFAHEQKREPGERLSVSELFIHFNKICPEQERKFGHKKGLPF